MNNIIQAVLNSTYPETTGRIWQYDYGQILRIQGQQLPKAVEIHFALTQSGGDSITRIGTTKDGVTDVPIPDSLLENSGKSQNYNIYAFVYIEDGTSGNTEYRITIPVRSRPKPEIPGTPEEPELFREVIKTVNDASDRAETAEKSAEAWAHGNEDYPERNGDNASYYAGKAREYAEQTETAKNQVENTQTSVENVASTVNEELQQVEELKAQTQKLAEDAAQSEQSARESSVAAAQSLSRTEASEGRAEQNAQKAEEDKNTVEQAKALVMELGQDVAEKKASVERTVADFNASVEQTVTEFNYSVEQALTDVTETGAAQKTEIKEEGATQVRNVQAVVEGISTEETAQRILNNSDQSIPLLQAVAEAVGKAGSLNGFGLETGANDTVVITYTNPETEVLEGSATFPTNTTLERIATAYTQMCDNLKIIALQKGADV